MRPVQRQGCIGFPENTQALLKLTASLSGWSFEGSTQRRGRE
jgi:hypothetical protein